MLTCTLKPVELMLFESRISPIPDFGEHLDHRERLAYIARDERECLEEFLAEHPQFQERLVRPIVGSHGTRYIDDDRGHSMAHYLDVLRGLEF